MSRLNRTDGGLTQKLSMIHAAPTILKADTATMTWLRRVIWRAEAGADRTALVVEWYILEVPVVAT